MARVVSGFALLLAAAGCSQRLPQDPAAQIAEVKRRMEASLTSNQKATWLAHVADNPTTAARDLLIESLKAPHPNLSAAASEMLRVRWIKDPETRHQIRAYYLNPAMSLRNRQALYALLIERYKDQYPEFADLPKTPPTFPGRVHIAPAPGKSAPGAPAAATEGGP